MSRINDYYPVTIRPIITSDNQRGYHLKIEHRKRVGYIGRVADEFVDTMEGAEELAPIRVQEYKDKRALEAEADKKIKRYTLT
jgi:hypothetical protein